MRPDDCRAWRERIGALLLDQLEPDERVATEAHLEACSACRAEAESLKPVASVLSRADAERLGPAPSPPPQLGERIVWRIASERRTARRRRARFGAGIAAAAAAAAAAGLALATLTGSGGGGHVRSVAFASVPKGVSVRASLTPQPWGSDVSVRVRGFRPGTLCRVWLRKADGTRVPAGSFRYVYAGESDEAALSSGVDPQAATAIGLRAGSRTFVAPLPSGAGRAGTSTSDAKS